MSFPDQPRTAVQTKQPLDLRDMGVKRLFLRFRMMRAHDQQQQV